MADAYGIPVSEFKERGLSLGDYLAGWSNQRLGIPKREPHHGPGFDLGVKEAEQAPRTDGAR